MADAPAATPNASPATPAATLPVAAVATPPAATPPAATPPATPPAATPPAATPPAAAPIEFKSQDGKPLEGPVFSAFAEMAKERGWTQEVANDELGRMSQALTATRAAQEAKWATEMAADKEFGGDRLAENQGAVKAMVEKLGGADAVRGLDQRGYLKDPDLFRLFFRLSKGVSPDKVPPSIPIVTPGAVVKPGDTSREAIQKVWFPDMNKK